MLIFMTFYCRLWWF